MTSPYGDETARLSDERISELRAIAEAHLHARAAYDANPTPDTLGASVDAYSAYADSSPTFIALLDDRSALLARLARAEATNAEHAEAICKEIQRRAHEVPMGAEFGSGGLCGASIYNVSTHAMLLVREAAAALSASHRDIQTNND